MELFWGFCLAIAMGVVIMFFQKKKMKASWQGVVTKIWEEADYYDEDDNFQEGLVVIHYRTDIGEKGKLHLRKEQSGKCSRTCRWVIGLPWNRKLKLS